MTAQDLTNAGYNVSTLIDSATISRWESIVTEAYIVPILGAYDSTDADQLAAAKALVYIALTANNTFATRAGGKAKLSPSLSERAQVTQADLEHADRLLQKLQTEQGAVTGNLDVIVDDVLHLYYRTYLGLNNN